MYIVNGKTKQKQKRNNFIDQTPGKLHKPRTTQ